MNTPSFRDIELISAYLDGQLSGRQKARLEARLQVEPALADALEELRQVKGLLRKAPKHRVPRNFTLTPKMAGIRPPVPRVVPALSWASAIASFLFVITLGLNMLGNASLAAAPKAGGVLGAGEGAPMAASSASTVEPTMAPALAPNPMGTPLPNDTPAMSVQSLAPTATSEAFAASGTGANDQNGNRIAQPPAAPKPHQTIPWIYIWPGLAAVLILAALLIRWVSTRAFTRRMQKR